MSLARSGAGPAAARHAAGLETLPPAGGRGSAGRRAAASARLAGLLRARTAGRCCPCLPPGHPGRCAPRCFSMLAGFPARTVEKLLQAEGAP